MAPRNEKPHIQRLLSKVVSQRAFMNRQVVQQHVSKSFSYSPSFRNIITNTASWTLLTTVNSNGSSRKQKWAART